MNTHSQETQLLGTSYNHPGTKISIDMQTIQDFIKTEEATSQVSVHYAKPT